EAAKRGLPGVTDRGLAGGVPEHDEASIENPDLVEAERPFFANPPLVEVDRSDRCRGRNGRLARIGPAASQGLQRAAGRGDEQSDGSERPDQRSRCANLGPILISQATSL